MPENTQNRINELEKQVSELQEKNQLLQNIIDKSPFGIQVFDEKGYSYFLNKGQQEILGLKSCDEGIGQFNILSDPYSKANGTDKIYSKAYKGVNFSHEFDYDLGIDANKWSTTKDKKTLEENIHSIIENGQVKYVVAYLKDVTEKKNYLKELRQITASASKSEETFRSVFEHSGVGIALVGLDKKFIDANTAICNLWGYTKDELLEKTISEVTYTDDANIGLPEMKKALKGEIENFTLQKRYMHKSGKIIHGRLNASIVRNSHKKPIYYIVQVEDLTDLINYQNKLISANEETEQSKQFYKATFDDAAVGIAHVYPNGNLFKVNSKFCEITGYSSEELDQMNFADISHPEDLEKEMPYIKKVLANEIHSFSIEKRYLHKNGHYIWIILHSNVVKNSVGKIKFAVCTISDISTRKKLYSDLSKAKERAEESEKKYMKVLNTAPSLIKISDITNGKVFEINNFALNFLGFKRDEIIGKTANDIGLTTKENHDILLNAIHNNKIENLELTFSKKNGEKFFGLVNGEVIAFNKKECLITIITDITELKKTALRLDKTLKEQNIILENDPAFIIFKDNKNNILRITETVARMTGLPKDQIEGRPSKEIYPDMAEKYYEADLAVMTSKEAIRGIIEPLPSVDGRQKWLMTDKIPYFDEKGQVGGIIVFSTDITKLKQYEQDLLKAKEIAEKGQVELQKKNNEIVLHNDRLESLLRISQYRTNSMQELLDFALEEAIKLTNSNIGYIYFYSEENKQFTLNTWSKNVMKDCSVINPQRIYALDKTGLWGEAVRQRKPIMVNNYLADNNYKKGIPKGHIQLSKFLTIPVFSDNKIVAVAGVANKNNDYNKSDERQLTLLMDSVWRISERINFIKDLKNAKERAEESNRLKTEFLHNMSHEVRTPMNGILGFSELLDKPGLSDEKRRNFSKIVKDSSQQLLRIIDDILEISTLETKQVNKHEEAFSLNNLMVELFSIYNLKAKEKNIPIHIKKGLHDNRSFILSDKTILVKILRNLLENAIKFTHLGYIELGYYIEAEKLIIYVQDTGIGIAKENHELIFYRFSQGDKKTARVYGGLGLGLSLSKENAQLLGGDITLKSEVGKGSTFLVSIQYKPAKTTNNNLTKEKTENDNSKFKILVAEDEEINYLFIETLFEEYTDFDYELIHALNGKEAVDFCHQHKDIDLILMDIKMPLMDGLEATKIIKEKYPNLPVIAQTAYTTDSDRQFALNQGCNEFISKPINKQKLFELIKRHLIVK